jgi:hypothetical protein
MLPRIDWHELETLTSSTTTSRMTRYLIILALGGSLQAGESTMRYYQYLEEREPGYQQREELKSEISELKAKVEELREQLSPKPKSEEDLLTPYQRILDGNRLGQQGLNAQVAAYEARAMNPAPSREDQQAHAEMRAQQAAEMRAMRARAAAQAEEQRRIREEQDRIAKMREIEQRYGTPKQYPFAK